METDPELLARLRAGDEQAFSLIVNRYQQPMVRFARSLVPSHAIAEEAVQDTWMAVVRGIDRFEERSSFKTWLFQSLPTALARRDWASNDIGRPKRSVRSTCRTSTRRGTGSNPSNRGQTRA